MVENAAKQQFKADMEATDQMIAGRRRLIHAAAVGVEVHIVSQSIMNLGNETEPYTEHQINVWIEEECGYISRRRSSFERAQIKSQLQH